LTKSKAHTGAVFVSMVYKLQRGSTGTLRACTGFSEGKGTPRGEATKRRRTRYSPRLVVFLPNNYPNLQNGSLEGVGPFLTNNLRTK